MIYLINIENNTKESDLRLIEKTEAKIKYKSILLPLIIVESKDISKIKDLKFIKDIEEDYYGVLENFEDIKVRPTINFSIIKGLLEYSNTKVCIIDSGIDDNSHLNIVKSIDYTNASTIDNLQKHGSKVANIINSITPQIQLLNAKITNDTQVSASDAIQALEWAYQQSANVINMSMGFIRSDSAKRRIRCKGECSICQLVDLLAEKGVLVVTAAGNDGPGLGTIRCPGNSPSSIAVGAINLSNNLAEYSSRGRVGQEKPDIITSGCIYSKKEIKLPEEGTSFSAPIITGVAAGIFSKYKNIKKVKEVILDCTITLDYGPNEEGKGKFVIDKLEEVLNFAKNIGAN